MKKAVAIIGAGISGLTVAQELSKKYSVKVFEKESSPGGLIRCKHVNGSLFHTCGGHVFNSKRQDVLQWFWKYFSKDLEFHKQDRNSIVYLNSGEEVPYPIENHIYLFDNVTQKKIIAELIKSEEDKGLPSNFEEFLQKKFGKTLYEMYFRPYNEKVWQRDLKTISLSWLEGKLPMPSAAEMIYNNINRIKEEQFVHSSFYYENIGGSQFIADRLAKGIDIQYDADIQHIKKTNKWLINGKEFDIVVFCGNIVQLPSLLEGVDISEFVQQINGLEYHGTTTVFCEIDANPYSWIYLPSKEYDSHRIICTGNFAQSNNANGKITATIEFTDEICFEDIQKNLKYIPLHPKYLDHYYNKYTYPIQNANTRMMITALKKTLAKEGFYMTGRFANWEYYNMDVAIGAAIDLCKTLL